jgi:hypothetical protein
MNKLLTEVEKDLKDIIVQIRIQEECPVYFELSIQDLRDTIHNCKDVGLLDRVRTQRIIGRFYCGSKVRPAIATFKPLLDKLKDDVDLLFSIEEVTKVAV